jgi:hypothetical protein
MAERLNAKRVEALLYLAGVGEDYLLDQLQESLGSADAATQAQSRLDDERVAEARIARRILRARWLTPKDAPTTAVPAPPQLPGFDDGVAK